MANAPASADQSNGAVHRGDELDSPSPRQGTEAEVEQHAEAPPFDRGQHFQFDAEAATVHGPQAPHDGYVLVTGQVPLGYRRVSVECEGGEVVEATLLPFPGASFQIFAAPTRRPIERIEASCHGGVQGIFFNVGSIDRPSEAASTS